MWQAPSVTWRIYNWWPFKGKPSPHPLSVFMCVSDPQSYFNDNIHVFFTTCYWSSSHLPKFRLKCNLLLNSPPPGQNECLHLAGWTVCGSQASLSSIRQFGHARPGVRAEAPPSAVFLPSSWQEWSYCRTEAPGVQAWRRQSPSQRRAGSWWRAFSPTQLRQSISFVLDPSLLTAVFKQQCWDPSAAPDPHPRPSGHSDPEGCSISWSAASSATATSATISLVQIESQLSISPNLDFRAPPGLPAEVKYSTECSWPSRTPFPGPQPHLLTCMGVSPRSLLTPSSQPQSPSSQLCSAFQVKMMSTYSLDPSWVQMRASHLGFQRKHAADITFFGLFTSDESYVEKGFVNCVCPWV